jgi:hypothetical protein
VKNRLLGAVVAVVMAAGAVGAASSAGAEPLAGPSRFVPVTPTRILDTRSGIGAAPSKVAANGSIDLQVTGAGGVPASSVTAVVLNVTVTGAVGPGYAQVFPTGQASIGDSSNLNIESAGQTIPNLVVVPVGNGGKVTIYTQGGGDLLGDVLGYFATSGATTAGRYIPLAPTRLLDTRSGQGVALTNPGDTKNCTDFNTWDEANRWFWTYYPTFGDIAKLDGNNDLIPCETLYSNARNPTPGKPVDLFKTTSAGSVKLQVRGAGGVPASGVSTVVLNVTATEATPGFVQVLPTGGAAFGAYSNLNVGKANQTIPNLVVVPIGADGTVTFYTESPAHLLADVAGYFTDNTATSSTNGLFVPLRPTRLLDTRNGVGAPSARIAAAGSVTLTVRGAGGVPATGASAAFLNVTANDATNPGYVQVYPTGEASPGSSSNLNVGATGQTIPNAVFATLSASAGQVTIYSEAGAHALADVAGYFTSGAGST